MKTWIASLYLILLSGLFPTPALAQSPNPVVWKTAYNQLAASDLRIQIGNQTFVGTNDLRLNSDPGNSFTTLEAIWHEHGIEMRLFLYFRRAPNSMWELYDARTYNAEGRDWIEYSPRDSLGNSITSLLGQRYYAADLTLLPLSSSVDAAIICRECSLTAFMTNTVPLSPHGYGIDFRIGMTSDQTITLTTDPLSGYGVNAMMVDSSQTVVTDQSAFRYLWTVDNSSLLSLTPQAVPYPDGHCAYGINPPCPLMNAQLQGLRPGVTQVELNIERISDGVVVASGSFPVKVVPLTATTHPSTIPTPTSSPSLELSQLKQELSSLQGEVGKIQVQVETQKQEISFLRQLINKLQTFISKLLGRNL